MVIKNPSGGVKSNVMAACCLHILFFILGWQLVTAGYLETAWDWVCDVYSCIFGWATGVG